MFPRYLKARGWDLCRTLQELYEHTYVRSDRTSAKSSSETIFSMRRRLFAIRQSDIDHGKPRAFVEGFYAGTSPAV